MIRKTLAVAGILGVAAIGVSACAAAPEPDSYSEQGKSTKQVPADTDHKTTDKKKTVVAKWKVHMNDVHLGMTMTEVKALLGKPADTDSTEMDVVGETTTMDNWTYGNVIDDDTVWMLSFTNGKLDSKSRI